MSEPREVADVEDPEDKAEIFSWDCSCAVKGLVPVTKRYAQAAAIAHKQGRLDHFVSVHRVRPAR